MLVRHACALTLSIGACAEPPVRWSESPVTVPAPATEMRLTVDSTGQLGWRPLDPAPSTLPASTVVCPGSLRVAWTGAREIYAIWWAPRADSSAALIAARSRDGGESWPEVAPVDTADRGVHGCRRPAASIVADASKGYVHVAYWLVAPGAPGIFFSHSMPGPLLFHAPVPIIYGERPGQTSIAANGDVVLVAYEDPNGSQPRVGLAVSRTLGHRFDHRVLVSTGTGAAVEPRVALAGGTVAVAWRQNRRAPIGGPVAAPGPTMVRFGELSGP